MRIGIDLMGSDTAPKDLLDAVVGFAKKAGHKAQLILFATPDVLNSLPSGIACVPSSEVIEMEDDPLFAIRRKKDSSLYLALLALQEKTIDALVTAGNTGALIAGASHLIPMLPGIERPALLALIPAKEKKVAVLDVGANTTPTSDQLVQFALMGIAYQKSRGLKRPTVGLLNIGSEAKKGTPLLRETYQKLESLKTLHSTEGPLFIGNVEGREVFQGRVDVLVTDGFTGNIFLKTAEGLAALVLEEMQATSASLHSSLTDWKQKLNYADYPGAVLCGTEATILKCHGNSSPSTFVHGIEGALNLLENSFLSNIKSQLAHLSN